MTLIATAVTSQNSGAAAPEGIPSQLVSISDSISLVDQNMSAKMNTHTTSTEQYVVFYDGPDGQVTVGKRSLDSTEFSFYNIADDANDVFGNTDDNDNHLAAAISMDSDGYLHVVANTYRDTTVLYMRSAAPGDITDWTAETMAKPTGMFSYPTFINCADGELLILFRIGVSVDGDAHIYAYDTETGTWSQRVQLTESGTDQDNMYWSKADVDSTGRIHLWSTWRRNEADPVQFPGNEDIQYTYSDDNGSTWRKKSDGSAHTLPFDFSGGESIATIPETEHLLNGGTSCVDADDNPHSVWLYDDDDDHYNIFHHWHNGSSWQVEQITSFTDDIGSSDTTNNKIGLPAICCFPDGTLWVLYRRSFAPEYDTVWVIDVTTPGSPGTPFMFSDVSCGPSSRFTIDHGLLRENGTLSLLLAYADEDLPLGMTTQGYLALVKQDADFPLPVPTTNFPVAPSIRAWWTEGPAFVAEGYADTNSVPTWPYERGLKDLTEATDQPTFDAVVAALNGKPAVSFDGIDDLLSTPDWTASDGVQPYSVTAIVNVRTVTGGPRMWDGTASERSLAFAGVDSPYYWTFNSGSGVASTVAVTTGAHIVTCNFNGANSAMWVDGVEIVTGDTGTNRMYHVRIGADQSLVRFAAADWAFLGIGPYMTDSHIETLHAWAVDYYGTPGA